MTASGHAKGEADRQRKEQPIAGLDSYKESGDPRYQQINRSWQSHRHNLTTFFVYPYKIGRINYTSSAIGSLNSDVRRAIKKRRLLPADESVKGGKAFTPRPGNERCHARRGGWPFITGQEIVLKVACEQDIYSVS